MSLVESEQDKIARNKSTVRNLLDAFQNQQWERLRSMMSDDSIWWVSGSTFASGSKSRDALIEQASAALASGASPFRFEIGTMTAEDDRVAVELESSMELNNGKTYRNRYHMLFVVEGNKIKSVREHMDTDAVMQAFGTVRAKSATGLAVCGRLLA